MAELKDFTPEQEQEAQKWIEDNCPYLHEWLKASPMIKPYIIDMYFQLKIISIELRPNQFVIGVDYISTGNAVEDRKQALLGKVKFNLAFWNPHPKDISDKLAKDFLIAKLSTL